MKQTVIGSRLLAGTLALAVLTALALPGAASATSADATILNVVTVTYKDAGGGGNYSATASASVTVDLLASPLDPGGPPTVTNPGGTVNPECPTSPYGSGTTARLLYALTATANGLDTYDLVLGNVAAANLNISSISHQTLEWDGTARPGNPNPATDDLGSAHVVGVANATTLQFPGGSLATAGFAVDDIVVVNGVAYLVDSISTAAVNVPTHTNPGAAPQTTSGTTNAETLDTMTLKEYPVTSILSGAYSVGSGSGDPDFLTTPPATGDVVGEMVLVLVEVTATVTSGASGDTTFTLTTTDSDGTDSTITCTVSFQATSLSIQKDVCNGGTTATNCTDWAATALAKPGEVLRYRVSIANTGSNATDVKVTDDVPAYTTLYLSGTDFAVVGTNGGAPSVTLTTANNVDEDVNIASGNVDGTTLNFFIGTGNSDTALANAPGDGGTVDNTTTYQIYYKVTID